MKEVQELLPIERAAERLAQLIERRKQDPADVQYLTAGSWNDTAVIRYTTAEKEQTR